MKRAIVSACALVGAAALVMGQVSSNPTFLVHTLNDVSGSAFTVVNSATSSADLNKCLTAGNAYAPAFGVYGVGANYCALAQGYTVSALPTGQAGLITYVTDAVACTRLAAPTGGGSTFCPLIYNGSGWVAM